MVKIHLKKYFGNYLSLIFLIVSFALYTFYKKEGISFYYIIAIVIILMGFSDSNFIKDIGLSIKILINRKLILYLIPSIFFSNLIIVLIQEKYLGIDIPINKNHLIVGFLFFNSVRIFGEEFIFRGFLLIKSIKENSQVFWILNIVQSLLFSFIHSLFVDELDSKIVFGSYVLVLSIYFGWLNNKFNSILPSWIIHWMNGLQTLLFFYI